jgi:hypothetical protein
MTSLFWQGGLAVVFLAAFLAALIVGAYQPRLRPLAFAVGVVAAPHALYYVLFVWFPDVLDGPQTQLFSILLRYQVAGLCLLALILPLVRGRWR